MEFASVWFVELFLPMTLAVYYLMGMIKKERRRTNVRNVFLLAVSFITFQSVSYLADVYTKKVKAAKWPMKFSLYMSLFAQMTQGPIMRYGDLGPQITRRRHSLEQFWQG
ncbi:MAG: hypothetical protein IJA58_01925 [Lachnospiraceae bacterium]|nr:hypothetical protein [Lachnospiraceae bacterium]